MAFAITNKIVVKHVWGKYQAQRWRVFATLLSVWFILPWIRIGERPAILLDIPGRKFHVFWATFWPQDIYLLALLLIAAAVALFTSSAFVGRSWCGYVCPQTVGTSIFLEIERWIDGDRAQQIRLAEGPWTFEKVRKRAMKHGVWGVISLVLSLNLLFYFVPAPEVAHRIVTGTLTAANGFALLFFFLLAYVDFAFLRDWVCKYPCPYGRFQGIMQDLDSKIVAFDAPRGEPRQFFRKGQQRDAGDCVDCRLCVDVCPMGIDIRNGPNADCISCMRCIDACAPVMDRVGFEPNLIKLASVREMQGEESHPFKRPRILVYAGILVAVATTLGVTIARRPPAQLDVVRNRSFLYQQLADGRVSNVYMLKALNIDERAHTFRVAVEGIDAELIGGSSSIQAQSGEVVQQNVALAAKPGAIPGQVGRFNFVLVDAKTGKKLAEHPSTFILPAKPQANVPGTSQGS